MSNIFYTYQKLLVFLFSIGFLSNPTAAQLLHRQSFSLDLINRITPQIDLNNTVNQIIITREMEDLMSYARTVPNPMERDIKTDKFLNRYFPYSETKLMKNGDIAYLKFYYEKYLKTLAVSLQIANSHGLKFETTRREFFKNSKLETRKAKRLYWRKFHSQRNELLAHYFQFRKYLIPALSTEISMILQEIHFPELMLSMNQLHNLDGTPLEVMIYSNRELNIPEKKGVKIAGLSIISKCENVFTSGSPAVRDAYPGLRGSNKGLTVHLRLFEDGVTLSHELGHLYYLYHKWEEYVSYIQQKGKDYEPGGHGPDDPSGLAAKMTENGVMPF